jgi:hypothetical protein
MRLIDYTLDVSDIRDDQKFLVFADIHEGSAGVDYDLLREDISEVRNEDNCHAFYLGDGADAVSQQDLKRFDYHAINSWYIDPEHPEYLAELAKYQSRRLCAMFNGFRDKFICGLKGNHGASHAKRYNFDPDRDLAEFMGWLDKGKPIRYSETVIGLRLTFTDGTFASRPFFFEMQHFCGGGTKSVEANLNWMCDTLGGTWANCDIFLTGHVHKRGWRPVPKLKMSASGDLKTGADYTNYGVTGTYNRTYVENVPNYGEGKYKLASLGALRVVINPFTEKIHCY